MTKVLAMGPLPPVGYRRRVLQRLGLRQDSDAGTGFQRYRRFSRRTRGSVGQALPDSIIVDKNNHSQHAAGRQAEPDLLTHNTLLVVSFRFDSSEASRIEYVTLLRNSR